MKTTNLLILTALAAGSTVMAQPSGDRNGRRPPPQPREQMPLQHLPPGPALFVLLDTDRDGALSTAEVAAAATIIAKADKNNDGEITPDELRPPRPIDGAGDKPPGPPPIKPQVPPVIAALDTDGDGTLSASELEGASESLKALDKNNDGELSPEELRRPAGPPPNGPQGPPPGALEGVE